MFHVTESRSNLIQYDKQQTVSELHMDKIVLLAKWKYPDKKYNSDIWIVCFDLTFFVRVSYKWNVCIESCLE